MDGRQWELPPGVLCSAVLLQECDREPVGRMRSVRGFVLAFWSERDLEWGRSPVRARTRRRMRTITRCDRERSGTTSLLGVCASVPAALTRREHRGACGLFAGASTNAPPARGTLRSSRPGGRFLLERVVLSRGRRGLPPGRRATTANQWVIGCSMQARASCPCGRWRAVGPSRAGSPRSQEVVLSRSPCSRDAPEPSRPGPKRALDGGGHRLRWASPIARQTRSGVIGISMCRTPRPFRAWQTALTRTPSAGVVPPSPPGRMPWGCELAGTSPSSVRIGGTVSARGRA